MIDGQKFRTALPLAREPTAVVSIRGPSGDAATHALCFNLKTRCPRFILYKLNHKETLEVSEVTLCPDRGTDPSPCLLEVPLFARRLTANHHVPVRA